MLRIPPSFPSHAKSVAVAAMLALAFHAHAVDSLTVVFTGDLLLGRDVGRMVRNGQCDRLFTPSIDSLFAKTDLVVANLECPATTIEAPVNKRFVFRADPNLLPTLRRHGITHLNLANNHTIDHGRKGLTDTYDNTKKSGMMPIGYGRNAAEAARPTMIATQPRNVYVLASLLVMSENYVYLPDRASVCEASVSQLCDTIVAIKARDANACVIVCLHWGVEHTLHPTAGQRHDAHKLIDSGADAVIGHHSHTAQDVEEYHGRPIFYSLGNFIFDLDRPLNRHGLLARLVITPATVSYRAIAVEIDKCRPSILR